MSELNDDQLFEELLNLKVEVASDIDEADLMPIYDEYFSSKVFDNHSDEFDYIEENEIKADGPCWPGYKQVGMKIGKSGKRVPNCVPVEEKSAQKKLKDPKGGLTAAGRAHFNRTEGSNLKPGVKGAADTPEKMRRKGSFLTRFFTNPSGPMVDEKGRATRLALSAAAWGERVPKNAEDAAKLAAKGRRLLERYHNTKKKDDSELVEEKQLQGQTIGQQRGGTIGATAQGSLDTVDSDGDGMIFDGTPDEQRAPYKRQSNSDYEKRRRKFVRGQLAAQGIKPNRDVADRSKKERDARARARAAFDKETVRSGAEAQAQIGRANTDAARDRRNQAQSDRLTGQAQRSSAADRKPADRIDNSPPARRIDSAERVQANRGTPQASDAATRRGQTDSRRPTSADDRRGADRTDSSAPARRIDAADRARANRGVGATDAASRRGQTDSRRPTSADDRRGADRADRSAPNRRPDSADREKANRGVGATDAATRRGQTDSRRPTSADDRRRPDSIDKGPQSPGGGPRVKPIELPRRGQAADAIFKPLPQAGPPAPKRTSGKNRNIRDF